MAPIRLVFLFSEKEVIMRKKKKTVLIFDKGYDGYYDDVKPEDFDVSDEKIKDDSSISIKVGALVFSALLIIAAIVVVMVAF